MTAPTQNRVVVYPPARARSLAAWHRQWVVSRYPDSRARNYMRERLGTPDYRPLFNKEAYYGGMMDSLVDHVVQRAVSSAKNKGRNGTLSALPAVAALNEVVSKSRKG
jgi:hypothetical protein